MSVKGSAAKPNIESEVKLTNDENPFPMKKTVTKKILFPQDKSSGTDEVTKCRFHILKLCIINFLDSNILTCVNISHFRRH